MPAFRCSICAQNWPTDMSLYDDCPICGENTSRITNIDAMPADEALSLKRQADFERFYDKWDAEHDPARLAGDADPL